MNADEWVVCPECGSDSADLHVARDEVPPNYNLQITSVRLRCPDCGARGEP